MADNGYDNTEILERLTRIETKLEDHKSLCPYREDIARASNNHKRLGDLEAQVTAVRLEISRSSLLSGGAGAGIIGVLGVIAKIAGWI